MYLYRESQDPENQETIKKFIMYFVLCDITLNLPIRKHSYIVSLTYK